MTTGILYLDIPVSLWGLYMWFGGKEGRSRFRSYFVVFTHVDGMSTGNEWRVCRFGGQVRLVQTRARLSGWVEPCSCVVSTVRYISGGVGGGQEVRLAEAEEQAAKRMLSRSLGDGSYMG